MKTVGDIQTEAFTQFASRVAPRLTNALVSLLGFERGQDAAWDALTHAWENWEKMTEMENPVGYLYVVGRNGARRSRKQRVVFPDPPADQTPWVEPGLSSALVDLPTRQRQAVILVSSHSQMVASAHGTMSHRIRRGNRSTASIGSRSTSARSQRT